MANCRLPLCDFAALRQGSRADAMRICLLLYRLAGIDLATALDMPVAVAEEWLAAASKLEKEINRK